MMRVSSLWPAAAGFTIFVLACGGGDRSREAAMQRDTTSPAVVPAPAPATDTVAPAPADTGAADTTPVAMPRQPQGRPYRFAAEPEAGARAADSGAQAGLDPAEAERRSGTHRPAANGAALGGE